LRRPPADRSSPNGSDDPTNSIASQTIRGYTAQEELADISLVYFNDRVSLITRFDGHPHY